MKVEIWSDVVCPFCYIGKRRFEQALEEFQYAKDVELEWKSFQLSPQAETNPNQNINQFLAQHKGISVDEARKMHEYVTNMATGVGLEYNFDKTVVANTFNAHRMLHFSKKHGLQRETKERICLAYFTEGKNIDDMDTLIELGEEVGLEGKALRESLQTKEYSNDVIGDVVEAQQLGIRGVPFFVFDRKYAVSGAQDSRVFLETLERSFSEWKTGKSSIRT